MPNEIPITAAAYRLQLVANVQEAWAILKPASDALGDLLKLPEERPAFTKNLLLSGSKYEVLDPIEQVLQLTDNLAKHLGPLKPNQMLAHYFAEFLSNLHSLQAENARVALNMLARLIQEGLSYRHGLKLPKLTPGKVNWMRILLISALPIEVLDYQIIHDFRKARLDTALANGSVMGAYSTLRTTNSQIHGARSVFCLSRQMAYASEELFLPLDLYEFMHADLLAVPKVEYFAPSLKMLRRLIHDLKLLKCSNPSAYMVIILALYGGLRSEEVLAARRFNLIDTAKDPFIEVGFEEDHESKSGETRRVKMLANIHRQLRKLSKDQIYIVANDERARADAMEDALRFLVGCGISASKPLHFARRIFGSAIGQEFGLEEARLRLGHADVDTTYEYYMLLTFTKAHWKVWKDSADLLTDEATWSSQHAA